MFKFPESKHLVSELGGMGRRQLPTGWGGERHRVLHFSLPLFQFFEHLGILITHLGNIAVPVPMFNSHPSLPWFFYNDVPFTVLGETEGCVHGRKTPGQLSSLPSLGFVADILSFGTPGGIGANIG